MGTEHSSVSPIPPDRRHGSDVIVWRLEQVESTVREFVGRLDKAIDSLVTKEYMALVHRPLADRLDSIEKRFDRDSVPRGEFEELRKEFEESQRRASKFLWAGLTAFLMPTITGVILLLITTKVR